MKFTMRITQTANGGSAPATPGFNAVAPEWLFQGAAGAAPAIPAAESTLGSHPCVALSSAQVLPEWINRNPAVHGFSANGDNPLNFVSHSRGSLQTPKPPPFISVNPQGPQTIGGGNVWTDHIGWNEAQVEFYVKLLQQTSQPMCGTVIKQRMTMVCPAPATNSQLYATNYITETVVAASHPNEPGQVVIGRCSEAEFNAIACPVYRTASKPWYAAKGRNK